MCRCSIMVATKPATAITSRHDRADAGQECGVDQRYAGDQGADRLWHRAGHRPPREQVDRVDGPADQREIDGDRCCALFKRGPCEEHHGRAQQHERPEIADAIEALLTRRVGEPRHVGGERQTCQHDRPGYAAQHGGRGAVIDERAAQPHRDGAEVDALVEAVIRNDEPRKHEPGTPPPQRR